MDLFTSLGNTFEGVVSNVGDSAGQWVSERVDSSLNGSPPAARPQPMAIAIPGTAVAVPVSTAGISGGVLLLGVAAYFMLKGR